MVSRVIDGKRNRWLTDVDEAVALGKALFWDMQLGSDYGRKASDGNILGTACASCHYRFGADARDRNTQAMAYQAWDKFGVGRDLDQMQNNLDEQLIPPRPFTQLSLPFAPEAKSLSMQNCSKARDWDCFSMR